MATAREFTAAEFLQVCFVFFDCCFGFLGNFMVEFEKLILIFGR